MQTTSSRKNGPLVFCNGPGLAWGCRNSMGRVTTRKSIATIHRSIELGITFLDTADVYGYGDNEIWLVWPSGRGAPEFFSPTKFGNGFGTRANPAARGVSGAARNMCANLAMPVLKTPGRGKELTCIYQHRVDPSVPNRRNGGRDGGAGESGQSSLPRIVRGIGQHHSARAQSASDRRAANGSIRSGARDPEDEILATTRELGIAFVAYSPLGRGFLTGQIKTLRRFLRPTITAGIRRASREKTSRRNLDLVRRVEAIAKEKEMHSRPARACMAACPRRGHYFRYPGPSGENTLKKMPEL